jgi:preprotein translocase subunit SecD
VAAPKSSSRGHPVRALAFIAVVTAVLYTVMFLTGDKTPRLGIDLAGGTSVTLKAKPDQGAGGNAVNSDSMQTAVEIIRDRVNAFGVSEAEVQKQGDDHIVISIPKGKNEKEAAQEVGQTARLYFRPVLAAEAYMGAPAPETATPTQSAAPTPGTSTQPAVAPSTSAPASATPSGGASAKPGTSASSGPGTTSPASTSARPQSRVIPAALPAEPAPAPTPPGPIDLSPPVDDTATQQQPSADLSAFGVTPELQAQYDSLNCDDPVNRGRGAPKPADQPVVACSTEQDPAKGAEKYILGPVAVDGTDLDGARAQIPQGTVGSWEVQLDFDDSGTKKFADITGAVSGGQYPTNRFAIELDGLVVSAPTVNTEIPGGTAVISGDFKQKEAKNLANVLKYGALPLSFQTEDVTTVSASLGGDQLRGGLIAGAIGIFLVVLYSLMYYRGLGILAIVSLLVSGLLTYAVMCLLGRGIGFALNLPAVCGAIAAIGITADSFIVYFERIRDEVREGRTLRPAVQKAWPRARRTILVSDFVSFLAAAVLYIVSVGKVKGFAFTLGLTTLLDIVVVFLFTKPLMVILAEKKFFASGHPWSGLDPKRLGATQPLRYRATRRPRPAARTAVDTVKEA